MRKTEKENLAERTGERWRPPIFEPLESRRARMMAKVRRFFDLQAGSLWTDLSPILGVARGTVVDVGCGAQPYRDVLPAGTQYVGLDTESALEDFGYAIRDVLPIGEDGRWPVSDGEADLVLATETLEHVPDPDAFLAEAARILRPGGEIVLTVPFSARWHYIPHDYWRFTPSSLGMLLERAGFTQVVVTGRGNERTVACYKLLALLLPLVLPQDETGAPHLRPAGVLALPPIVLLTVIANLSLRGPAGDDCLGFTVRAVYPYEDRPTRDVRPGQ
jgi:SAM-dependent methyltransferase